MIQSVMPHTGMMILLCLLPFASASGQVQAQPAVDQGLAAPDAQSRCLPWGPPPEEGYQRYEEALADRAQAVLSGVPGYLWRHGCGPTAAGMVVGYWDGLDYESLIPGDASTQTSAVNQAIASGNGSSTHYSDYSLPLDSSPDPVADDLSEPPAGDEHDSHCLGDFMRTSWSAVNNYYGWSWYHDVDDSLSGYVDYVNATCGTSYLVNSWNESWGSFSWADYRNEIDDGRPMVFLVDSDGNGATDHFVTAIGYRDTYGYNEYACLDTWSPAGSVRWERFRQLSSSYDWGIYGATFCVMSTPDPANTLAVGISCLPGSGTVPFSTTMLVQLENLASSPRAVAASLTAVIASGQTFPNWRAGYTNLMAGETFSTSWVQTIPALGSLIGSNDFVLHGVDVTPGPYNQPPYAPSGDSDTDRCQVIAREP